MRANGIRNQLVLLVESMSYGMLQFGGRHTEYAFDIEGNRGSHSNRGVAVDPW